MSWWNIFWKWIPLTFTSFACLCGAVIAWRQIINQHDQWVSPVKIVQPTLSVIPSWWVVWWKDSDIAQLSDTLEWTSPAHVESVYSDASEKKTIIHKMAIQPVSLDIAEPVVDHGEIAPVLPMTPAMDSMERWVAQPMLMTSNVSRWMTPMTTMSDSVQISKMREPIGTSINIPHIPPSLPVYKKIGVTFTEEEKVTHVGSGIVTLRQRTEQNMSLIENTLRDKLADDTIVGIGSIRYIVTKKRWVQQDAIYYLVPHLSYTLASGKTLSIPLVKGYE